jgi:hypothetical protein
VGKDGYLALKKVVVMLMQACGIDPQAGPVFASLPEPIIQVHAVGSLVTWC